LEVRLEAVRVPHWIRGIEAAELIDYPAQGAGASQKIVLTALGGTTPTPPDGITAEMVVVDNFDQLAASGRQKVAGKIVLFNELFDKQKAAAGLAWKLTEKPLPIVQKGRGGQPSWERLRLWCDLLVAQIIACRTPAGAALPAFPRGR